jgi:SfnB family sulfur acquisition oxidoreductase
MGLALRGFRFGNALVERNGKNVLDFATRVSRQGDAYILSGTKFYATGALFAHLVPVHAVDDDGKNVLVFADRDAKGLQVIDDWSGIGQRTTASGTVILDRVKVSEDRIVPAHLAFDVPTVHGAVAQIIQAAIDAGIARRAIDDTIRFIKESARPWVDSGKETAAEDPFTIRDIAGLKIKLHAAEAVLFKSGRVIDAGLRDENAETSAAASIAVAEAKVLTTEIAILATNKLFELGGTRSALAGLNLDRHWRDARTHALHDPVRWKALAIGDYIVNGTKPRRHSWL